MGTYHPDYNCTYKPPKSSKGVISRLMIRVISIHGLPSSPSKAVDKADPRRDSGP